MHKPFNSEYSVKPQEALFCPALARVNSKNKTYNKKSRNRFTRASPRMTNTTKGSRFCMLSHKRIKLLDKKIAA